jgi:dolichol-phosphate mannosyltransferase
VPGQIVTLSIIIPTFQERDNILLLLQHIKRALAGIAYEVIVVDDDSPDGTADLVKAAAASDSRIRCIKRIGRRGLSGACIEGILSSSAAKIAIMDADMQHDEKILRDMVELIDRGADLVVGSRYTEQALASSGFNPVRAKGSQLATQIARRFLGIQVTDPLSGFFMMKRAAFDKLAPSMSQDGFKLLLDILFLAGQTITVREVAYTFRERHAGDSKLDLTVTAHFAALILSRATGSFLPPRYLLFIGVGVTGLIVHLAALMLLMQTTTLTFLNAQLVATLLAMTSNFFLNNLVTYRDQRLKGWRIVIGLLTFYAVCSFGVLANVSIANVIFSASTSALIAGLAGALISSVFNYATSRILTWRG